MITSKYQVIIDCECDGCAVCVQVYPHIFNLNPKNSRAFIYGWGPELEAIDGHAKVVECCPKNAIYVQEND